MNRVMLKVFYLLAFTLISTTSLSQINYYVSTTGNDSNPGTSVSTAFKTIEKAKSKVYTSLGQNRNQNITVNILGGIYEIEKTLKFDSLDSPNDGYSVTYQKYLSEKRDNAIISGGKKLTGWTLYDDEKNIWKTNIKTLYSRQIYYDENGTIKKSIRARSEDNFMLAEISRGYIRTCGDTDFSEWDNVTDLEVVSYKYWVGARLPVAFGCGNLLIIDEHLWNKVHRRWDYTGAPMAPSRWIENNYKLIDADHEWFIDRSGSPNYLYYKFPENSTPGDFDIYIPTLEMLIYGENAQNISFKNLEFRFTSWLRPSNFISDYKVRYPESNYNRNNGVYVKYGDKYNDYTHTTGFYDNLDLIPAALQFYKSSNIQLIGNTFNHLGSGGVQFRQKSDNNLICSNKFQDISASAINISSMEAWWRLRYDSPYLYDEPETQALIGQNNRITNNLIDGVANDYFSSSGIFIGLALDTEISHNTIKNFSYAGISMAEMTDGNFYDSCCVGNCHGIHNDDDPNHPCPDCNSICGSPKNEGKRIFMGINDISYNYIDCAGQFMYDTGAIYMFGYNGYNTTDTSDQNRSTISNNYLLNAHHYMGSLYLDEASSNINVYNNLVNIDDNVELEYTEVGDNTPNIFGIYWWSRSYNLRITDNYVNNRYEQIPDIQYDGCLKAVCDNIEVDNNNYFNGFSNHGHQSIIDNAGYKSTNTCN